MTDLDEQIRVIDLLIRRAKTREDGADDDLIAALADIAKGLRARRAAPEGRTLEQLEDKLRGTLRTKTRLGYSTDHLTDIGVFVIGHWPALRQALEAFREDAQ